MRSCSKLQSEARLLLGLGLRPHRPGRRSAPGFGLIAEAKSGAMSLIGVPGEPPPLFRMPIADMYAGMHGVSAICAALFGRVSAAAAASTSTSRCTTA